ncbi:hypothetical protein F5I97DRAFT_1777788, partial [Phlebopus sp. FC_14]
DIICLVNVQHNCIDSKCLELTNINLWQEHILILHTKSIVKHQLTPLYFLNMYFIHNYHHIKSIVPEAL